MTLFAFFFGLTLLIGVSISVIRDTRRRFNSSRSHAEEGEGNSSGSKSRR